MQKKQAYFECNDKFGGLIGEPIENVARMDFVVYTHSNRKTNEIFYVGIGNPSRSRIFINRSQRWHNYVNKYGKPKVRIYRSALFEHEAARLEQHLISVYGRRGIEPYGCLVNLDAGGLSGRSGSKLSQELKDKLSKAHKGKKLSKRHIENIRKYLLSDRNVVRGRPVSEETRKKMSDSAKKRRQVLAEANSKKVINVITGEIYPSAISVARMLGIPYPPFARKLSGGRINKTDYKYL